jgi:hypothetical protein
LLLEQPEQEEPALVLPPLLKVEADICFLTLALWHLGHLIFSLEERTSSSKS